MNNSAMAIITAALLASPITVISKERIALHINHSSSALSLSATDTQSNSDSESLTLIRYYAPANPLSKNSTKGIWRHNYEYRLMRQDESYWVITPQGNHYKFTPTNEIQDNKDGMDQYFSSALYGKLKTNGRLSTWSYQQRTIHFQGRYPIRLQHNRGRTTELRYENFRIKAIKDSTGDRLDFLYKPDTIIIKPSDQLAITWQYDKLNRLNSVNAAQNWEIIYQDAAYGFCPTDNAYNSPDEKSPCDPYNKFDTDKVTDQGSQFLDIRPANCSSFFENIDSFERGRDIEAAVSTHADFTTSIFTPPNFPIIDRVQGNTAVLSRSLDLSAAVYTNGGTELKKEILRFADQHSLFKEWLETNGSVTRLNHGQSFTIHDHQIASYQVELVVQHGIASRDQIKQVADAATILKQQFGIKLSIIEIP